MFIRTADPRKVWYLFVGTGAGTAMGTAVEATLVGERCFETSPRSERIIISSDLPLTEGAKADLMKRLIQCLKDLGRIPDPHEEVKVEVLK